jgi:hypothetical protein
LVVNYYDVMVKILWVGGIIFIPTEDKNNSAEGRTCKPEGGIIPTIPTGKSHPAYRHVGGRGSMFDPRANVIIDKA